MTAIEPHDLWRGQPVEAHRVTPAALREKARAHDALIRRRNLREYIAGGAVMVFFLVIAGWMIGRGIDGWDDGVRLAGFVFSALGTGFVLFQLARRTGPASTGDRPTLIALRDDLLRQRDALDSAWLWYFTPFLPGLILIYGADIFVPGASLVVPAIALGATFALFAGLIWLNHIAARHFDSEIAALERDA